MKSRRAPQPGEVWRSRVQDEEKRTVLVLDVGDGPMKDSDFFAPGERARIQTLTTTFGNPPLRTTRTRVLLTNWHHTFAFDRDATTEELADAGLDIPKSGSPDHEAATPAGFYVDHGTKHRFVTIDRLAQIIRSATGEPPGWANKLAEAIVAELGKEG